MSSIGSKIGTGINYLYNAISIASHIHKLYENWTYLYQHPHAPTTEKLIVYIDGLASLTDIAAVGADLRNRGFELRHAQLQKAIDKILWEELAIQGKNLLERINYTWKTSQSPDHLPPLDLSKSKMIFNDLCYNTLSFRRINAIFAYIGWISLMISLTKHYAQNGISSNKSNLIEIFIKKFTSAFSFYSNAQVGNSLSISLTAKIILYPLKTLSAGLSYQDPITLLRIYFGKPISIPFGEFNLVKFSLPSTSNDPSSFYSKMPQKYYDREPFRNYRCAIDDLPITKALFIFTGQAIIMCEKDALIKFIFEKMQTSQPLIAPKTQQSFKVSELYVDPIFDDRLSSAVIHLKNQERRESHVKS